MFRKKNSYEQTSPVVLRCNLDEVIQTIVQELILYDLSSEPQLRK